MDKYYSLRDEIDKRGEQIIKKTGAENFACREGCCSCCTAISLLPVEFYSIIIETGGRGSGAGTDRLAAAERVAAAAGHKKASGLPGSTRAESTGAENTQPCAFLKNFSCLIYSSRPVICRTQGLPLLYLDDEGESLSIALCDRNFTDQNDDYEFNTADCLDLDRINSQLYKLNLEFIKLPEYERLYLPTDRIELNTLYAELKFK